MSNRPPKERKENPWDPLPWPKIGEASPETLYAAMGEALSNWEDFDATLGAVFAAFVSDDPRPAERAYFAIRTFEGRLEMVRAASTAYFDARPNTQLQERLKELISSAKNFSERRNEIAHSTVDLFRLEGERDPIIESRGYALFPTRASFRHRDVENTPRYCYTTPEINYFSEHFNCLVAPAADLCGLVSRDRLKPKPSSRARSIST